MIISKNKGSCAYAKSSKSKPKPQNQSKQISPRSHPAKDQKQNIYDDLMNELEAEDSSYIQNLLLKQERKEQKKEVQSSNNQVKTIFGDKSNQNIAVSSSRNSQSSSARRQAIIQPVTTDSKRSSKRQKDTIKTSEFQMCRLQNERYSVQSSVGTPHVQQSNTFIDDINKYLGELNKQQRLEGKREKGGRWGQESQDRQFRKTIEICERQQESGEEWRVGLTKYNKVLNQLQESLLINDALQEKLEYQNDKMGEMKNIIKCMWGEIQELKGRLEQEHKQKQRFTEVYEQFAVKMERVHSRSKEKHYLNQHKKRNSHIPESGSISYQNSFSRVDLHQFLEERKHINLSHMHRERQEPTLKKKGKQHRYKMSENYLEYTQKDPLSTASIYNEQYQ